MGLVGALVIGVIAVLASIPKEAWIGFGVVAAIGIAIYLYRQSKAVRPMPQEPEPQQLTSQPVARAAASAARRATAQAAPRFVADDAAVSLSSGQASPPAFKVPPAPRGYGAAA